MEPKSLMRGFERCGGVAFVQQGSSGLLKENNGIHKGDFVTGRTYNLDAERNVRGGE